MQDPWVYARYVYDYLEDPWPGLSRGSITVWRFHICRLNQCSGLSTESMTVYRTNGCLQDPWLKAGSITVSRTHGWDFPQDPCMSVRSVIVYDCLNYVKLGSRCRLSRAHNWSGEAWGDGNLGWEGGCKFMSNLGPGWTRIAPHKEEGFQVSKRDSREGGN
jgi:hypothetical protein